VEFEDKGVLFYSVYTTEPYETEMNRYSKISDKNQTKTHDEYVDYALEIIKEESQKRPILIDFVGPNFILKTLGAMNSNSLIVIDKEGKKQLMLNNQSEVTYENTYLCMPFVYCFFVNSRK